MTEYDRTIFARNLLHYMEEHDFTRADVQDLTGVTKGAVADWVHGRKVPRMDKVALLAKRFGCSIADLLEGPSDDPPGALPLDDEDLITYPVIGNIAAGYDGRAIEEETGDVLRVPKAILRGRPQSDYMVLRVKGDSMSPQLLDGDQVVVLRCTSVDPGSIAVVMYDGWDATVKRVQYVKGEDWLELVPLNPAYPTKRIEGPDLTECRVLGKVVDLIRHFD